MIDITKEHLLFFIIVNIVLGLIIAMTWSTYKQLQLEKMKIQIFRFCLILSIIVPMIWYAVKKIDNGYKAENIVLINKIDTLNRLQYKFDSIRSENIFLLEKVSKFENTMNLLEKEDTACYTEFVRRFVLFE